MHPWPISQFFSGRFLAGRSTARTASCEHVKRHSALSFQNVWESSSAKRICSVVLRRRSNVEWTCGRSCPPPPCGLLSLLLSSQLSPFFSLFCFLNCSLCSLFCSPFCPLFCFSLAPIRSSSSLVGLLHCPAGACARCPCPCVVSSSIIAEPRLHLVRRELRACCGQSDAVNRHAIQSERRAARQCRRLVATCCLG